MKEKKKPLPVCETGNGNGGISMAKHENAYATQFITTTKNGQGIVESILQHGRENAITKFDLMKVTGIKNVRDLRSEIEYERKHGALILSDRGADAGYYLPADGEQGREELRRFVASYMAQAVSMLRTVEPARQALSFDPEQEAMFLE